MFITPLFWLTDGIKTNILNWFNEMKIIKILLSIVRRPENHESVKVLSVENCTNITSDVFIFK